MLKYLLQRMARDIVTSLRIDKELWKEARKYAIDNEISVRELIESLLREKLNKQGAKKDE